VEIEMKHFNDKTFRRNRMRATFSRIFKISKTTAKHVGLDFAMHA
jgi:hypothetical protein